jgi:hypothetical protein
MADASRAIGFDRERVERDRATHVLGSRCKRHDALGLKSSAGPYLSMQSM